MNINQSHSSVDSFRLARMVERSPAVVMVGGGGGGEEEGGGTDTLSGCSSSTPSSTPTTTPTPEQLFHPRDPPPDRNVFCMKMDPDPTLVRNFRIRIRPNFSVRTQNKNFKPKLQHKF